MSSLAGGPINCVESFGAGVKREFCAGALLGACIVCGFRKKEEGVFL